MFSNLYQVQWEPVSATKTCFMFCCFYYKQWEPAFSKHFGPQLEALKGWPWPWQGMQWTKGVSRIPKMPPTHFFRKSAGPGFDVLVLICYMCRCRALGNIFSGLLGCLCDWVRSIRGRSFTCQIIIPYILCAHRRLLLAACLQGRYSPLFSFYLMLLYRNTHIPKFLLLV